MSGNVRFCSGWRGWEKVYPLLWETINHMRYYQALIDEESRRALAELSGGIIGIGLYPAMKEALHCYLALVSGGYVHIQCIDHSLEWKFEVFTPVAEHTMQCPYPVIPLEKWSGKNRLCLLRTEEWQECANEAEESMGRHPIAQYQVRPGMVPPHALNRCLVDAGIVIENARGESLIVAAAMSPLWLYVSGFTLAEEFDEDVFARVPFQSDAQLSR